MTSAGVAWHGEQRDDEREHDRCRPAGVEPAVQDDSPDRCSQGGLPGGEQAVISHQGGVYASERRMAEDFR